MPMLIITGYPCSGKTTRANELKTFFESERGLRAHIIIYHNESVVRNDLYSGMFAYYRSLPGLLLEHTLFTNNYPRSSVIHMFHKNNVDCAHLLYEWFIRQLLS